MIAPTPGPWTAHGSEKTLAVWVNGPDGKRVAKVCNSDSDWSNALLIAEAPAMVAVLKQALDESGFSLSGATDHRAAEHGEPHWVCNSRAIIARIES